jgi:DNA-binding response OmpR family regulator
MRQWLPLEDIRMRTYHRALASLKRIIHGSGATFEDETQPQTVLIVDDEESIRRLVERVLREAGCRTVVAHNGAEAVSIAATMDRLDVLVTDLMMPHMNGDELARRLRVTSPDLPVLYLTGFSDRLFADRIQLWENEAFLDKPCSVKGLLEAVSLVCRRPIGSLPVTTHALVDSAALRQPTARTAS